MIPHERRQPHVEDDKGKEASVATRATRMDKRALASKDADHHQEGVTLGAE